jgi:8-oxo-dGTP diphosphatase
MTNVMRKIILAVLIYAERDGKILMLHRNARPGIDYHDGKWNGLGGKCAADESAEEAAAREFREECGIQLEPNTFEPLGTLQFPNFKPAKEEDWLVIVLRADIPPKVEPWTKGPEGDLHWIAKDKVLKLNLWPGDKHFIPKVLARQPFMGTIWYEGEKVVRHQISDLKTPTLLA